MSFYNKSKISLAFKTMLVTSVVMAAFFALGGILIYWQRAGSLRDEAVKNHGEIARLLSSSVVEAMEGQFELIKIKAANEILKNAVVEKNWIKASDENSASGAENALGDIVFDDSSKKWNLTFLAPVRDESGKLLGIYKSAVDISTFFKALQDFKIGQTGNAAIVDDKSYLVFHPKSEPFINKFCSYQELRMLLDGKSGGLSMDTVYLHGRNTFVVFAEVEYPPLLKNGIKWYCVVSQDEKELLSPLNALMPQIAKVAVFLFVLTMFAGFILGRLFVKPLEGLKEGIKRLADGDLDYTLKPKGGDELGQLAAYFDEMTEGVKRDLRDLKKVRAELEKTKEEITRFTRIKMNMLSILSQVHGSLSNIKTGNEVVRISRNIDILLDIAGIESGSVPLKREVVDIKDLIKKAIFIFEPKVKEKGLDFKLNMPREKVCINADLNKITKVLDNLMQNAVKFTEKGLIEVSIRELNDKVEFSIADTGIGISREKIPYIFDGLQPGKNDGLGLYFAKTAVKAHSGEIWVQSEAGKGTKFTFIMGKAKPA